MKEKMTVEKAAELLGQGFHCSQVVMWHTADFLGLDKKQALKFSGGLGGGCFHGDVCGVVSAAVVSLSMKYGYNEPYSTEQNAIMVDKIHEFEKRFTQKHGTLLCRELLGGYSFSVPEQAEQIMAGGLTGIIKNCPVFCADACDILDDMFAEAEN